MKRSRLLLSALFTALALVAGACGSPDDGTLRALPGGGGATGEAAAMVADEATTDAAGRWAPYRPTTYVLGEGVTAPKTAKAYELTGSAPSKAAVQRLATALGLDGKVEAEERAFFVRDGDAVLEVRRIPLGPWMVTDEGANRLVDSCAVAVDSVVSDPAGDPADAPVAPTKPKRQCPEVPPAKGLLSAEDAIKRVKAILEVGASSSFEHDVSEGDSSDRTTSVQVTPRFDGHDLEELSSWFEFGEEGRIIGGQGFFGGPKSLGDYPLVSARGAVDRLNAEERDHAELVDPAGVPEPDPRGVDDPASSDLRTAEAPTSGGASTGASPAPEPAPCPPEAGCVSPEPVPPVEEPAEREPVEPLEVEVTGLTVGYSLVPTGYCEDDAILLVPHFVVETDDGERWVDAVTDEHLAATDSALDEEYEPCPEDAEGQEPGREPGGGSSSGSGGADGIEPAPLPAEVEPDPAPEAESKVVTTSR